MSDQLGIGVIGCRGFGLFALQQFVQVPGVRLAGMAGTARPAALAAAQRYGLEDVVDVDRLLDLPAVDVVYISTPPFLHYEQSKLALAAGKHVICEKPLALTVEQADELVGLARRHDRLLVANLMQRYNPLFDIVGQVIDRRPLGEFLHGYFENYASDENLPPEHWFWDREKSGGIFVEHGVHFFDMLTAGPVPVKSFPRRPVAGPMAARTRCNARCATRAARISIFTTAFISRVVWIASSFDSSSNAATCCCKVGCQRASAFLRWPMSRRRAN